MLAQDDLLILKKTAWEMRRDVVDLCYRCGTAKAHLGGCMSTIEILAVLYTRILRLDKSKWDARDRFIMSKGHAGLALYSALKQAGILTEEDLGGRVRGPGAILTRHPRRNPELGIECSSGSLGMGIGYGVGLAEAANRRQNGSRVFVMLGDGECNEGSVWEAAAYAGHNQLSNFTVVIDANGLQLDGPTENILDSGSHKKKWEAFGFEAVEIEGHDLEQVYQAFSTPTKNGEPKAIIAHTIKGKGISFAENKVEWHDNYLSPDLYQIAQNELEGGRP